nr:GNAT family N-acetyltransferase [Actinomycetota bacterium]
PRARARGAVTLALRKASARDAETLFAVQKASSLAALAHIFPTAYPFPDEAVHASWRDAVAGADGRRVLVAERDGVVVGGVSFSRRGVDALYVVPAAWRQGVGSALHDAAVEELRAVSDEARLWVLADNADARRFYERRGWRPDGREQAVTFPPHPLEVGYSLRLR